MNGYVKIALISSALTFFSVLREIDRPLYPIKISLDSNIKRIFWRWLHWNIIIFASLFVLFFRAKKFDKNIAFYYSIMTITILHWYSSFCMISLLETKHYDIDPSTIKSNNVPHIKSLFFDNYRIITNIFYFSGILNFLYITFYTKNINKFIKYGFFIAFVFSFLQNYLLAKSNFYEKNLLYKCLMSNPFI